MPKNTRPPVKRRRPPSISELNKIVATNQAMANGDELVAILGEQGIDAKDPAVARRLKRAERNVRKINQKIRKGWLG